MAQPLSEECETCGADDVETCMQVSGAWICSQCATGTLADPNYSSRMEFVDKKKANELVTLLQKQDASPATQLYAGLLIAVHSANFLRWSQAKVFDWYKGLKQRV